MSLVACMYVNVLLFLAQSTKRAQSKDTLVSMSTHNTQILVSKYHSPLKGLREPGLLLMSKNGGDMLKRHKSQLEHQNK